MSQNDEGQATEADAAERGPTGLSPKALHSSLIAALLSPEGRAALAPVFAQITDGLTRARDWFIRHEGAISAWLAGFGLWLERLPDETRSTLVVMGNDGWFLDGRMPAALQYQYRTCIDAGEVEAGTALMRDHFEARKDGILAELSLAYPHRSGLLGSAFSAMARGEHGLAIPVLLAQADGFCFDTIANGAFFQDKGREAVKRHLLDSAGDASARLAEAYLAPFAGDLPLLHSSKQRPVGFTKLNRHQVLHGESIDYGTPDNSLRAISLLVYIAQRLEQRTVADSLTESAPDGQPS
jgi:hypothetical protein